MFCFGQGVVRKEFTQNDNKWRTNNANVAPKFSNGFVELSAPSEDGATIFYRQIHFEADKPYSISATLQLTTATGYYGLHWGSSKSYYTFVFNNEQKFCIYQVTDGGYVSNQNWTETSALKQNEFNKLEMKFEDAKFKFSVNQQPVLETLPMTFSYAATGIFASPGATVRADVFDFQQHQSGINAVEKTIGKAIIDLGSAVNSVADEESLAISDDGSTLYFSRLAYGHDSDIYISQKDSLVNWSEAESVVKPLNNAAPNYVIAMSIDKTTLFLGNKYSATGAFSGEGISVSNLTSNGWTIPKPMKFTPANYSKYIYYNISADGKTMIVNMQSQKTRFDLDLYVSLLDKDSVWSTPMVLPANVNTLANEAMAFLDPDNITLYYSTNGKPGFGGYDLFMTRRLDDTWLVWSDPFNLGAGIKSKKSEMFINVPANGHDAYLVYETENAKRNVGYIPVAEELLPRAITVIYEKVYDRKTKKPLSAEIHYENLNTQKDMGSVKTNKVDGSFKIALVKGYEYGIRATAGDYLPVSRHVDLTNLKKYQELKYDLFLVP